MPGFFGLGKQKTKNVHDIERERQEKNRSQRQNKDAELAEMEKRSWEKVQEILSDQGDAVGDEMDKKGTKMLAARQKGLALKVADVMSGRVATVKFDDTVMTVKGIFSRVRFHHLPVVDDDGRLIGILSDRDFLASVSPFVGTVNEQSRDIELMKRKVGLVMTRNPSSVTVGTDIIDAIRMMNEYKVSCLPVIVPATKQLLGIVTWKDIVRAFCPEAFTHPKDSSRLKTGVNIRPKVTESGRFLPPDSGRFESRGPAGGAGETAGEK